MSTEAFDMMNLFIKDDGTENKVLGRSPIIKNSNIFFRGNYNTLYCEDDVIISNSSISFLGNNSLIFLGKGQYYVNANIGNNSVLYIGKNNYFNPYGQNINIYVFEHKNVFIGNNNNFSMGINIRVADAHIVYDNETNKRTNLSKSVYIADHTWIGQNSMILKGTEVHSGTIIGAQSVTANKKLYSNSIYAGNPIKQIKTNIHWDERSTNLWTEKQTEENLIDSDSDKIYAFDEKQYISFETIEKALDECEYNKEKLDYLINLPQDKNRFTYFG